MELSRRFVLMGLAAGAGAVVMDAPRAVADDLPTGLQGASFSSTGNVQTLSPTSTYGGPRVNVGTGGVWTLNQSQLAPNTEHTIFFRVKAAGKLSFRLSGFKSSSTVNYLNGTGNVGTWETSPAGRANKLNWLEHLGITRNEWLVFRYDFTTGDETSSSARATFTADSGNVEVDGVRVVTKASLGEAIPALPPVSEMSRGHRLILEHGFQFLSWVTNETFASTRPFLVAPSPQEVSELGLTGLQFNDAPNYSADQLAKAKAAGLDLTWATADGPFGLHTSGSYQDLTHTEAGRQVNGLPTPEILANGFLTNANGLRDVDSLIGVCIGDEENYSDTLTQNLKAWFEVVRKHYPHTLAFHNQVGTTPPGGIPLISTFNDDMLDKYMSVAKPDLISFDLYYFRERRMGQTIGGTAMDLVSDLDRYRRAAGRGHDGTGRQPIPWGHYHYSWRTGPGAATDLKRGDGWYELTESQVNIYSFMALTFGATWMSNFRYLDDNAAYLFTDYRVNPDGTFKRYKHFDWYASMIDQSKNIAPHLLRLRNREVAVVQGLHRLPDGRDVANARLATQPAFADIASGEAARAVFLSDVKAVNLGTQNNGLAGDVFVGLFDRLGTLSAEDAKVFTSTDPRYFMILNGLTAGDGLPAEMQQGSAHETRQEVTLRFSLPNSGTAQLLRKVSRVVGGKDGAARGNVTTVPLQNVGGGSWELKTTIGGGLCDLYYWELGSSTSSSSRVISEPDSPRQSGDPALANPLPRRDLAGRTITIGVVPGATGIGPKAQIARKPATPANVTDGQVLNVTLAGDIAAIGERYYTQDIWEFRLDRIQRDNNVTVKFVDLSVDLPTLRQQIASGVTPADVVVVPDSWLWKREGNLVDAGSLRPWSDQGAIDVEADKWKAPAMQLGVRNGKAFGLAQDHTTDFLGLFVNHAALRRLGADRNLITKQRWGGWTLAELRSIAAQVPDGSTLFGDTDDFLRQLLISSGVDLVWGRVDPTSAAFVEGMTFWKELRDRGLLLTGTPDEVEAAFGRGELSFMVRPYSRVEAFREAYFSFPDNTSRVTRDLRTWGRQTMTWPQDGAWKVTAKKNAAGAWPISVNDFQVLLFPVPASKTPYRQAIVGQSMPVLPRTTTSPDDVAFIMNELMQEYVGVWNLEFTRREPREERMTETRDLDTVRKVGLRDSYGDTIAAAGLWDEAALADLLRQAHLGLDDVPALLADADMAAAHASLTRALMLLTDLVHDKQLSAEASEAARERLTHARWFGVKHGAHRTKQRKNVRQFIDQARSAIQGQTAAQLGATEADRTALLARLTTAVNDWA